MQDVKRFGTWRAVESLGAGGNGRVWRCTADDGAQAAVKVLHARQRDRITRFRNEIKFLIGQAARNGIVPLIDHNLPDDPGKIAWYAMPIAEPIRTALGPSPDPDLVVGALGAIAGTLAELADDQLSHRDIKSDNLFRLDGQWAVGDFGLVKYPDREPVTKQGRKLGPIDYMAPEMRENPDTADAERADVYSLAKTLWVLFAGVNLPFPGQHRADDEMCRLTGRLTYRWAPQLDLLIEQCTGNDPDSRPRMREVSHELDAMLRPPCAPISSQSTVELQRRINSKVELHRRRQDQRLDFHQRVVAPAWQGLEQTGKAAFWDLANLLPAFGTYHPTQMAPPSSLLNTTIIYTEDLGWSGSIVAPEGAGVRIDVGVRLRVHDQAGHCTVVAMIRVNRHNAGRGLQENIIVEQYESAVGSAHFEEMNSNIRDKLQGIIPTVLQAVENALEAEQQSHRPD
jgi:serine/threonine protein kinase